MPNYNYKDYQAPFSFFRGTILQPAVNGMGKLGVKIYSYDKSLYHTKFGEYLEKVFKFDIDRLSSENTGRRVPQVTLDESGQPIIEEIDVLAYKLKGNPISKLIGKALLRIPIIGIFALGLLELPNIIKRIYNADGLKNKLLEGTKQTVKSFINVTSILSGIGLIGGLFARKGPVFSVLGMGIGSVAGIYTSKAIQNKIDNLTQKS